MSRPSGENLSQKQMSSFPRPLFPAHLLTDQEVPGVTCPVLIPERHLERADSDPLCETERVSAFSTVSMEWQNAQNNPTATRQVTIPGLPAASPSVQVASTPQQDSDPAPSTLGQQNTTAREKAWRIWGSSTTPRPAVA